MKTTLLLALFLVQADERERWLPAIKTVSLPREERTVRELLEAVREQTGLTVEPSGLDQTARVTLGWEKRPVLQALDDLCRALGKGDVRSTTPASGEPGSIELDGAAPLPPGASHWNQFRVEVEDVQITTRRSLEGTKRTARATLRLTGQPGTRPLVMGAFTADEAVDDAGWSLLAKASSEYSPYENYPEGEDPDAVIFEDRVGSRGDRQGGLTLELRAPAEEARAIARLTGRILVTFPMRHVTESIPVGDLAPGKEIRIGGVTLRVTKWEQKAQEATFAYTLVKRPSSDFSAFLTFDLLDEKGQRMNSGHSGSGSGDGYTMKYTFTRSDPVAALRYRAYIGRVTIAVPVDFRDVPLPKKP